MVKACQITKVELFVLHCTSKIFTLQTISNFNIVFQPSTIAKTFPFCCLLLLPPKAKPKVAQANESINTWQHFHRKAERKSPR